MINLDFKNADYDSILISIVLFLVVLFINAWIITVCWNEYLIHAINGLHEIDMMHAIALRILASTLTSGISIERQKDE